MSLLEDVFLEDEAGEAQELERVIEGDEYDERPLFPDSDDNEEKDDEAEEDKRRVDPTQGKTKRVIKNPRFVLNPARLTGPRGIQVLPEHFKDFKFKGKGHEKEDLDMVLKKLEHWAYRLYPKFGFHDCLKKIEILGKKRAVMVHLQKIRSDQFLPEETVVQKESSDEETPVQEEDEFDKLLQQQIDIARATPAPGSVRKPALSTPSVDRSLMMPKATSSPSISDEQRERMLRNRRLAEERRLAKLKNDNSVAETPKKDNSEAKSFSKEVTDDFTPRKQNRSNVIDSSDEDEPSVNQSITVDVHSKVDEMDTSDVSEQNRHESPHNDLPEVIPQPVGNSNEPIDEVIIRKHNRSNVIDSSDEDEPLFNKSISDDVHSKVDDIGSNNVSNKNPEQNSVEAITEQSTPNKRITNDEVIAKKHNRSNIIDSSDYENEIDTPAVDIQGIVGSAENKEIVENQDSKIENETEDSSNIHTLQQEKDSDSIMLEQKDPNAQKDDTLSKNDNDEGIQDNLNTDNEHIKLTETNKVHTNSESTKGNGDSSSQIDVDSAIDEVMDVDFSEEF